MKLLFVNFSVYLQRFMLLDKCRKVQRGIPPQGAGVVVGGGGYLYLMYNEDVILFFIS